MKLVEKWKEGWKKNDERNIKSYQKHPRLQKLATISYACSMVIAAILSFAVAFVGYITQEISALGVIFIVIGSLVGCWSVLWVLKYDRKIKKMAFPKTIVSMILISGILFCSSVSAIEDLGTMDYKDYAQKDIISPSEVNLTFIFSTLDETALTIDKILYIPSTNKTKYVFTSNVIETEWWMNFSTISFFYQDENTLEIYEIKIDYNNIEIPANPWEIELDILQNVSADLDNLTTTYNTLKTDYDTAIQNLIVNRSKLNTTTQEYTNLSIEIKNLTKQFTNMTNEYHYYYNRSIELGINATLYQNFYTDMNSDMGLFSFKDPTTGVKRYYMPKASTDSKIENMQSQLDIGWLWIILAIMFTAVIVIMLVKLTSGKRGLTSADLASSGYTKDMWDVDKLGKEKHGIKDKINKKLKTKKKTESPDQNDMEKRMKEIAEESSEKTMKLTTELNDKINLLLAKFEEPKKNVKA